MYLDFRTLSTKSSIEQAAAMLNLILHPDGNRLIGPCPACGAADIGCLVVSPQTSMFFCSEAKVGGDLIGLVQHMTGLDAEDAASYLGTGDPLQ